MLGKVTIIKKSGKSVVIDGVGLVDIKPPFARVIDVNNRIIAMFNCDTIDEILLSDRLNAHNQRYELVKEPIVGADCTNFN